MHRTGTRIAIAAGLAVGLSFTVAPQWVSGSTGSSGETSGATPIADVGAHLWPTDAMALPAVPPATTSTATTSTATTSTATTSTAATDPAPAEPAQTEVAEPVPAPVDQPVEPIEHAEIDTAPEPIAEPAGAVADVPVTGTIQVEVAVADGASRVVSLRSADGAPVAGPVTVDGSTITFDGLDAGIYDVFAEQFFDGGGTFLTRTTVEVAGGGEHLLRCDDETLDCTVS